MNKGNRGKDNARSCRYNLVLARAPVAMIVVKHQGVIPTGQAEGAEIAIGPWRLAHSEAKPRVRGREVYKGC